MLSGEEAGLYLRLKLKTNKASLLVLKRKPDKIVRKIAVQTRLWELFEPG